MAPCFKPYGDGGYSLPMSTNETTSPSALRFHLLASVYGVTPEECAEVASHNLLCLCAWQMGKEGLGQAALNKLLLAPSLSEKLRGEQGPDTDYLPPRDHTSTIILQAAGKRAKPFTSKDLGTEIGLSGARVGQVLTTHRWPRERAPSGNEITLWLPRGDVTVGMESK